MSPMYPGAISFRSCQSVLFNQILEADSQEAESQLACNPLLKTAVKEQAVCRVPEGAVKTGPGAAP